MNCQDISRTLESRNVNALSAAERQACDTHAASCSHCGPEWVAYTHLAAIPPPPMPHMLAAQCEALAAGLPLAAPRHGHSRRARNRFMLIGALAALSAAAAMIEVVPRVVAESPVPETADENGSSHEPTAERDATAGSAPMAASAGSFTVHLLSLQHDSPDAAAQRKVQEYHTLLAEGLRAVPGLQLLDDQAVASAGAPASYRISISNPDAATAQQALTRGYWAAMYRVEVLKTAIDGSSGSTEAVYVPAEGHTRGGVGGPEPFAAKSILAPLSGECPSLILCTPQSIAEWQIKDLRLQVFPLDGSIQQDLEARFLDPSLAVGEHIQALNELQAVTAKSGSTMGEAVVREALARIESTSDADSRNLYWTFLAGQRRPEIIPPLIDMALQDPDEAARRAAVLHLATDFPEAAAVRAALQSVARNDRKQLNRKVAERVLLGDGPWNDYVVATMKDTAQTVQQRLEPLRWMIGQNIPMTTVAAVVLGEDKQMFIDLLLQADKERQGTFATRVLGVIGSVKHPATAGFVLAVFEAAPDYSRLRLLEEHLNDPGVRARVEQIAADPTDETLQVAAVGMLDRSKGG
jgi:hypothetical protein